MSSPLHRLPSLFAISLIAELITSGCAGSTLGNAANAPAALRAPMQRHFGVRRAIGGGWQAQTFLIDGLQRTEEEVACPTGKVNSGAWSAGMAVPFSSRPTDDETGWLVDVLPLTLDVQNAVTVYAHCGVPTPHWQKMVEADMPQAVFTCPSNQQAFAGGWGSASDADMIAVENRPSPDDSRWMIRFQPFKGKGGDVTEYVNCIDSLGASYRWTDQAVTVEGVTPASLPCTGNLRPVVAAGWGPSSDSGDAIPLIAAPDSTATQLAFSLVPSAGYGGQDSEEVYAECS